MNVLRLFFNYKVRSKTGTKPDQKQKKLHKTVRQGWSGLEIPLNTLELRNIFYTSIYKL